MKALKLILKIIAGIVAAFMLFVVYVLFIFTPPTAEEKAEQAIERQVEAKEAVRLATYQAERKVKLAAETQAKQDVKARTQELDAIKRCVVGTDALFVEVERLVEQQKLQSGDVYKAFGKRIIRERANAKAAQLKCYDTL